MNKPLCSTKTWKTLKRIIISKELLTRSTMMMLINIWRSKKEIERLHNTSCGPLKKQKRLNKQIITTSWPKIKPLKPVCWPHTEWSHITSKDSIKAKLIKLTWKDNNRWEKNSKWINNRKMRIKRMPCNLRLFEDSRFLLIEQWKEVLEVLLRIIRWLKPFKPLIRIRNGLTHITRRMLKPLMSVKINSDD